MTQRISLTERATIGIPTRNAPPKKQRQPGKKREHFEQVALFGWVRDNIHKYPALEMLFAVPNGGHRHINVARQLQAEGVKPGVPDLFLPVASQGHHGLFIEMKATGGRESEKQQEWRAKLTAGGFLSVVCVGWMAASEKLAWYLSGGETCECALCGHLWPMEAKQ